MPIFLILIALIIVLFVVGVSFVYSGGWNNAPTVNPAEMEKKEEEIALAKSAEAKANSELTLTKQELEEAKGSLESAKQLEETVNELQEKEKAANTEIEKLKEKVDAIFSKADTQAKDALDVISTLKGEGEDLSKKLSELKTNQADPEKLKQTEEENQNLKSQCDDLQAKLSSIEEQLNNADAERQKQIDEANQTIEELRAQASESSSTEGDSAQVGEIEGQLENSQQEQQQKLDEVNAALEELKAENQALRAQLEQGSDAAGIQRELDTMKQSGDEAQIQSAAVIENLQFEKSELQKQVEESMGKIQNLKEEILRLKGSESTVDPSQSAVESVEESRALKALCEDFRQQLEQMKQTVTTLREEGPKSSSPSQEFSDLHERLTKMKEINTFLLEKEKLMQLELTKSRVQAMGLAKICEDFKVQADKMSKNS